MCQKLSQRSHGKILLLSFLRGLLEDNSNRNLIIWTDRANQEFKMVDYKKVAELWGATKPGRKTEIMSYDNMCKSLRSFCSKDKTLVKVEGRNFTWRFLGPLPPLPPGFSPKPLPFNMDSILGTCSSTDNALTPLPSLVLTPPTTPPTPNPTMNVFSNLKFPLSPVTPLDFFMTQLPLMAFWTPITPGAIVKKEDN